MKRLIIILLILIPALRASAVLKEQNLEQTLNVLRVELTESYQELIAMAEQRKQQTRDIIQQLRETMKRSNQNALMLYSQQQNYVFDLTYACHEATEQYLTFQRQQLPFKSYIEKLDSEIAKYDSLVNSLRHIRPTMLDDTAKIDRTVCLTLATSIRNTLSEARTQVHTSRASMIRKPGRSMASWRSSQPTTLLRPITCRPVRATPSRPRMTEDCST